MPIDLFDKVLPELVRSYREEGRPRFPEGTRDHVILVFESLVAIPILLEYYTGRLGTIEPEVPGMAKKYKLDENDLEALRYGHWQDIPDTALAMLMLRPGTIMEFRQWVDEELPHYWLKVYEREENRK